MASCWKWQVEKGPLWPREKGPPMSCAGCRDVAGRSEARGEAQVATSAIVVSPPVARGSLVAGGGLEAVAVTGGGQHGGVVHDAVDDGARRPQPAPGGHDGWSCPDRPLPELHWGHRTARDRLFSDRRVLYRVGDNRKFPICGNRKPHTFVVGGFCPVFHDVGETNSEEAGRRCTDGRQGCC